MRRIKLWFRWHFGGLARRAVESALSRIQKLEQRQSKLSIGSTATADELRRSIAELLESDQAISRKLDLFQAQLDDLRRLLTAREADQKPIPIRARNWREVQNLVNEDADVPA